MSPYDLESNCNKRLLTPDLFPVFVKTPFKKQSQFVIFKAVHIVDRLARLYGSRTLPTFSREDDPYVSMDM